MKPTEATIVIDADGHVVLWNPGAEQLFGWTTAEMVGQTLERIMPRHHWQAHQAALARLREGESPRLMGQVLRLTAVSRAGETFPIDLALDQRSDRAVPEPGDWRYVGIIRRVPT